MTVNCWINIILIINENFQSENRKNNVAWNDKKSDGIIQSLLERELFLETHIKNSDFWWKGGEEGLAMTCAYRRGD